MRDGIILFLIAAAVYWSTWRVPEYSDPVWNTRTAVSIAERGSADISMYREDLSRQFVQFERWMRHDGENTYAKYPVLVPLLAAPFYYGASLLGMDTDGWAMPYVGKFVAALFAALSVVLVYLTALKIAPRKVAFIVALVYALCTSTFSVSSQALFQHGPSQFFLAASLFCFFRAYDDRKALHCIGFLLVLSVWARPLNFFLAGTIFVYGALRYRKAILSTLPGAGIVVLAALVTHLWLSGSLLPPGYGAEAFKWDAPFAEGLLAWLVSPGRGLLFYTPIFFFSVLGIFLIWRKGGQGELRALSVGVVLTILVAAKWHSRGGGFSYRLLVDLSVPLCLFLVPVLTRLKGRLALSLGFYALTTASFLVQVAGAATFFTGPPDVWRLEGGRLHCAFKTRPKLFDIFLDSQMSHHAPRYRGFRALAHATNSTLGGFLSILIPFPLPDDVRPYCRSEAIGLASPPRMQNVILISIDSLRADHLSCYGYGRRTSPNLDEFAKKAVLFEQAVSQSSWTLPAHASLLTSLYPITHGVDSSRRRLASGVETLAVWLKERGYYTGAMVSGPFMKKLYGFDRGFLDYDDDLAVVDNPHSVVTSPRIQEKAERFLAKHGNRPFFLFLHYWDVHYDYNPPAPCDTLFDKDYKGSLDARDFENNSAIHADMNPRDILHLEALYDGEIRYVDEHLGALFSELKKRRLMRETLIVITADHGDEFFEHGEKGHSHSLYEELIHVPLIIRPPGGAKGVRIDRPVALIDIAPTVMDLLGFGPEVAGVQGRSLKMLMENSSSWKDEPIWSETRRARKDKRGYRGRLARSMRFGMLKGIFYEKKDLRLERYEYYDLATDPGEQVPVREDLLAEIDFPPFQQMLSDWVKAMEKTRPKDQEAVIDPKTLEALRSLGYGGD